MREILRYAAVPIGGFFFFACELLRDSQLQHRLGRVALEQGADGVNSMQNVSLHMQMLRFLRPVYQRAKVTLHAGELAPDLCRPTA